MRDFRAADLLRLCRGFRNVRFIGPLVPTDQVLPLNKRS
jgi:hypothetical protein